MCLFIISSCAARPPGIELQESDATLLNVKRRIPQDIKQKLAKVARLAVMSLHPVILV